MWHRAWFLQNDRRGVTVEPRTVANPADLAIFTVQATTAKLTRLQDAETQGHGEGGWGAHVKS